MLTPCLRWLSHREGGWMSLRDQLLAKGVVSKKDVRRVERELKDERRSEQGSKDRKTKVEAEQAAARAGARARAALRDRHPGALGSGRGAVPGRVRDLAGSAPVAAGRSCGQSRGGGEPMSRGWAVAAVVAVAVLPGCRWVLSDES